SAQQAVDSIADALPHFVGRSIGEGDGDDVVDRDFFGAQNFQITLHQNEGLAGAGSGRDGQMTVKRVSSDLLFGLKFARLRVRKLFGHRKRLLLYSSRQPIQNHRWFGGVSKLSTDAAPPSDVRKASGLPGDAF